MVPKSVVVAVVLTVFTSACSPAVGDAGTTGGQVPTGSPPIADAYVSKCGSCHERPQPKLRSRDYIESAMKRHKKRVSLDEEEWQAMIDFMAK